MPHVDVVARSCDIMRIAIMLNRRAFVIYAAGLTIAARSPASVLDRAIRRAGGSAALRQARALKWKGEATIHAGQRRIDIGVSTHVIPFVSARSDSWLLSDGPAKTRSLIVEPQGGWIERDGKRTPMPDAMLQHERAQYAIYGLMLLVPLSDPGASGVAGPAPNTLLARHPGAPDTTFGLDPDGRLAWASNSVRRPEGEGSVEQRFEFSGSMRDRGVRWPARIEIAQDRLPYFDLRLSHFEISA